MCGDVRLHLLKLITIVVWGDAPLFETSFVALLLLIGEISLSQLVDYLVLEGGSTHGRFKDLQIEEVLRLALALSHLVEDALQGIFHGASGQNLRRIVAGRLLAVTTIQAIDAFRNANMDKIVIDGMTACRRRSEELGKA